MSEQFDPKDHVDALFDRTYLRWFSLNGKPALVEIKAVRRNVEMVLPGGHAAKKTVLDLKLINGQIEEIKPLVLNTTNAHLIASFLGDKPSQWPGKEIVLYQDTTKLRGETVACIRVRAPKKQPAKQE